MCFGGGGGTQMQQTFQSQSGSSTYDPWVTGSGKNIYDASEQWVAQNPWQKYSGPLTASFGEPFNASKTYLSNLLGKSNPALDDAAAGYRGVMGAINPNASISDYMSPYLKAVLAPQLDAINQSAGEQGQAADANATMQGAYGGSGAGLVRALLNKNTQQQIANTTGKAYNDAFTNAQGARLSNLQALMSGSQGLAGVGQQQFGQNTTLASLLAGLGSQEQQAGQQGITNAIGLHTTDQMGQLKQLLSLSSVLGSLPKNQYTQSTSFGTQQGSTSGGSGGFGMQALGTILGMLL